MQPSLGWDRLLPRSGGLRRFMRQQNLLYVTFVDQRETKYKENQSLLNPNPSKEVSSFD